MGVTGGNANRVKEFSFRPINYPGVEAWPSSKINDIDSHLWTIWRQFDARDVTTGATGANAVAPKFTLSKLRGVDFALYHRGWSFHFPVVKYVPGCHLWKIYWGFFCLFYWCYNMIIVKSTYYKYCNITSTSPSHLEAHAGFFRLSMKGKSDVYLLWPFGKKLKHQKPLGCHCHFKGPT